MRQICVCCEQPFDNHRPRKVTCPQCDRACVICGGKHKTRGLCGAHYMQWLKAGKPAVPQFVADVRAGKPVGRVIKACAECGTEFRPDRSEQYCSDSCRTEATRRRQREHKRAEWKRRAPELRQRQREYRQQNLEKHRARDRARQPAKPPKTLICQTCGEAFQAKRKDAKYCSHRCRPYRPQEYVPPPPPERKCVVCGNTYRHRHRRKYCSDSCAQTAVRERQRVESREGHDLTTELTLASLSLDQPASSGKYVLQCEECGREFRSDSAGRLTCGKACRNRRLSRRKTEQYQPVAIEPVACVVCNEVFRPQRAGGKTCSTECRAEYHRRQESARGKRADVRRRQRLLSRKRKGLAKEYRCTVCGKDLTAADDLKTHRYTCSDDCRREAKRRNNRRSYLRRRQKGGQNDAE